jgi:outer membrane protein assembly factor BamE (lipoprotein component of BamABCDE complex)
MNKIMQYFSLGLSIIMLSGCLPPIVNNRGHVDNFSRFKQLKAGETTRQQVQELLGTPSITNNFGAETWYYVQNRKEAIAFLDPEITKQKVTRIVFNADGVIEKLERYDAKDSKDINLVKDVTPTEGQELGVVEQILGNVGRFNSNAGDRGMGARSPSSGGGW